MPRKQGVSRNPPGVLCFPLNGSGHVKKRARYESERRKEVAEVRAVGACLRCQLMKMPCSGGRPCVRCAQAALSSQASSHLWLLPCVPSALAGLKDFFKTDIPMNNSKIVSMLGKNNHLVLSSVFLEFDDKVEWDLTALSVDWALWLSQNNRVPQMSKVGAMSSLRFQQLLSPWISNKLGSCFRLMMHTSSLIYSLGVQDSYCGIPLDDFYALRSHAGTHFLVGLERLIRPAELANASLEKKRATFLLLFGAVIAVTYNERVKDDIAAMLLHDHFQRVSFREFSQNKEQLVRVLAYRLIDIADRLGLLENGVSKQRLIDSAKQQWHLPASFVWQDSLIPFESAMLMERDVHSSLSSLCGGHKKHLEGPCSSYTFDSSTASEDRLNLFTRPPTVPIIVEREKLLGSPLVSEVYTPTCRKCGIVLPDGLPDKSCYTCAFFDWDLFESEGAELSPKCPRSEINVGQSDKNTSGLDYSDNVRPGVSAESAYINLGQAGRDRPYRRCGFYDLTSTPQTIFAIGKPTQMGSPMREAGENESAHRSGSGDVPADIRYEKAYTRHGIGVPGPSITWKARLTTFRAFLV